MMEDERGFVMLSGTELRGYSFVASSSRDCGASLVMRTALVQCGNTVRMRRILYRPHNAVAFIQIHGSGLCLRNLLKYGEPPPHRHLRHAL